MFTVAECFLLSGSVTVLKHTMSISRAKLVSDGPESLIVTGSQQFSSEPRSDAALPNTCGSNTFGDVDEVCDEADKAGGDKVEEVVKAVGEGDCDVSGDSEAQAAAVTDVVPNQQLSGSDPTDVHDIATTSSAASSSTVKDEPTVKGCDNTVTSEDESEEKEVDRDDRSLNERPDGGEETADVSESDAAKQAADVDVDAVELSRDEVAADANVDRCNETDNISTNQQTLDAADTLAAQTTSAESNKDIESPADVLADQTTTAEPSEDIDSSADTLTDHADTLTDQTTAAQPSIDTDMSIIDVVSEKNEATALAEEAVITVLLTGIPRGLDETVELYLESEKKGGGKLRSFKYNQRNGSALVVFADNRGDLLYRSFVFYCVYIYIIRQVYIKQGNRFGGMLIVFGTKITIKSLLTNDCCCLS